MSYLYVCEQGATIGFSDNRFQVKYKDNMVKSIPSETLEMIEVFGNIQLTTQCIDACLRRGVNILYYSRNGAYFGKLISTNHVNVSRQRQQAALHHNHEFRIEFAKRIISAKIHNQIVVLRRYARSQNVDVRRATSEMSYMIDKISDKKIQSIEQIMGYEGISARTYFKVLGNQLIDSEFSFQGRNRQPPRDPFNSLISLGYSIIMNEIYGKLEGKGLNPYFGFMHSDREKHPTLASDLMEEWRAVLIDSTALSMLNGHELTKENFYQGIEEPGVFLDKNGFKRYIEKLEKKFRSDNKYLTYVDYSVSFRRAIDLQVNQFVKAIENEDASLYQPIWIR